MDAAFARSRSLFLAICSLVLCVSQNSVLFGQERSSRMHSVATPNFVVFANNPQWAQQVAEAAESNRKSLAVHWLGQELPQWSKPCQLIVQDGPNRLASGETQYSLFPEAGAVVNFRMTVVGTQERIIDSVLPHEITHTIVASHFAQLGKPIPRWADEGMCTTVEHETERRKHDKMLVEFLRTGKGIPFRVLFELKEYPQDILPLYAQGYSVTSFLIAQGGPQKFIKFLEAGIANDDWVSATESTYGYARVGNLQLAWRDWVSNGGGEVANYTAASLGMTTSTLVASNNPMQNDSVRVAGGVSDVPSDNFVRTASAQAPVTQTPMAQVASLPERGMETGALASSSPSLSAPQLPTPPSLQNNPINGRALHLNTESYYANQLRTQQELGKSEPSMGSTQNLPPAGQSQSLLSVGKDTLIR